MGAIKVSSMDDTLMAAPCSPSTEVNGILLVSVGFWTGSERMFGSIA